MPPRQYEGSLWPAIQRVYRWPPAQWAIRAAGVALTVYAVPWAESRASRDDLAVLQGQIASELERRAIPDDSDGRPITLAARMRAVEGRLQRYDQELATCRAETLSLRLDLVGFQAASSQPKAMLRAQTAKAARAAFLELRSQLGDDAAYRRALETRPPR
jgi:hypothetical protein